MKQVSNNRARAFSMIHTNVSPGTEDNAIFPSNIKSITCTFIKRISAVYGHVERQRFPVVIGRRIYDTDGPARGNSSGAPPTMKHPVYGAGLAGHKTFQIWCRQRSLSRVIQFQLTESRANPYA
jgi:hypothetical protein